MTNAEGTLDDVYLEWLYSHIAAVKNLNPERSYWHLARQLYTKRFVPYVHNDGNRAEDGKQLRVEFLRKTRFPLDDPYGLFMDADCSMFEMLLSLAKQMAFEADSTPLEWFWIMMSNLEINRYSDDLFEISISEEVEEVLDRVINRTYAYEGTGGLFPLRNAARDQRRVELWYQKEAYLLEGLYSNVAPPAERGR